MGEINLKTGNKKKTYGWILIGVFLLIISAGILIYIKENEYKKSYNSFLEDQRYRDDFYFPDDVRYELAYVDEDKVPELFLAQGNSHVDQIAVYSYNTEEKQVEFIASFSSFGSLSYVPKKNMIISQYGNHGFYYKAYSAIKDGKVELIDICLSDGSKDEMKYFWDFPVEESFTGGYGRTDSGEEKFGNLPEVTEQYRISKEEYEKKTEALEQGSIQIKYDEMKTL